MTATTDAPVVVGVDGSDAGLAAVGLAVRMTAERHRRLRVVHAFTWPLIFVPVGSARYVPPEGPLRDDAARIVEQAQAYARGCDPRVDVSTDIVTGGAAEVLIQESHGAVLVVLGDRGCGWFAGLLLGSVAVQVTAHAAGPVVVARGDLRTEGPIVVGVDGSPISAQAVMFAAEEAVLRETSLLAVQAWTRPVSTGPGDMVPLVYDADLLAAEEARLLAESVAGLAESHPGLTVEQRLVEGRATPALIEGVGPGPDGGGRCPGTRRVHGPAARLGQPGAAAPRGLPGGRRPSGARKGTGVKRLAGGAA